MSRETDPERRAELHAIRSLLMVAQKALSLASATAANGQIKGVVAPLEGLRDRLYVVENEIVERLAVN